MISVVFRMVLKPLTSMIMRSLNIRTDHYVVVFVIEENLDFNTSSLCAFALWMSHLPDSFLKNFIALHRCNHCSFIAKNTFLKNLKTICIWLNVSNWASHFASYPDPIKTFGQRFQLSISKVVD